MKVLLPLMTYSSPTLRAVVCMPPNASDPEPGSVMAQAPILSKVSRSRTHRSRCSGVPRFMIVPAARPRLTPIADTRPGATLHSSMIGSMDIAALPPERSRPSPSPSPESDGAPARSRSWRARKDARHLVHAERLEQVPQQVVRRQVARLQRVQVRPDLRVDPAAHRVPDHQVFVGPLDHALRLPCRVTAPIQADARKRTLIRGPGTGAGG